MCFLQVNSDEIESIMSKSMQKCGIIDQRLLRVENMGLRKLLKKKEPKKS